MIHTSIQPLFILFVWLRRDISYTQEGFHSLSRCPHVLLPRTFYCQPGSATNERRHLYASAITLFAFSEESKVFLDQLPVNRLSLSSARGHCAFKTISKQAPWNIVHAWSHELRQHATSAQNLRTLPRPQRGLHSPVWINIFTHSEISCGNRGRNLTQSQEPRHRLWAGAYCKDVLMRLPTG